MLSPYDPTWQSSFASAAAHLRQHGNPQRLIEHIGSTAIPGMMAKPIIDLAVCLSTENELDRYLARLETHGWRVRSGVTSHEVLLFEVNGVRERIAHFFRPGAWPTAHQRVFRDWLRSHPADAELYAQAKIQAAAEQNYNAAKTSTVQEIMNRARTARGLPVVDINDK
ncbi:GrpB family protein [Williamsia sp. M5A3_1d]